MLMLCLVAPLVFALAQVATAERPTAATPPSPSLADAVIPTDPTERVALGQKMNGAQMLDDQPWHLKASYEVFDRDGNSKDKGTFEEWRVHAKQYKLVFRSPQYFMEEYRTDQGLFRTGGMDWPGSPLSRLERLLVQPIPASHGEEKSRYKSYSRSFGSLQLQCVAIMIRGGNETEQSASSYCFAPTNAVLLYQSGPAKVSQTIFEHVSVVHGQYVAHDITVFLFGKPWLKIHLDRIEPAGSTDLPSFTIPASALPVDRRIGALDVVQEGRALKSVAPDYPVLAKTRRVEGLVALSATIGKDGHIKRVEVLGGPPLLQKAATEALKQEVYAPSLVDGEPVEEEIDVNVEFHLN